MPNSNNRRIAKNTAYLYLRMLFTLFVGLFTSRVVLNALGVHDYGLYNVVAGVISLLGYVSSLLNQGTSRFLTIGLGKGNLAQLSKLFTACFSLHIVISLFTLAIGETVGVWFVNTQLVIDGERMFAANIVYQLALFSSIATFIQAPFQASIISHEKMGVFAWMSIYDVVAKLLVAFLLLYVDTDKLILYSVFYFLVGLSSILIYNRYCRRHFEECSFKIGFSLSIYKEIVAYIGWNAVGTFAYMANAQGFNILLNMFFTTVVNAARGLSVYVSGVVSQFVSNFQAAARPQITKYYALGNIAEMHRLICNCSKYSAYMLILMGVPVLVETDFIVGLWLGHIPQYVVSFIRITIIQMLITSLYGPLADGVNAIGKMKKLNIFSVCNHSFFLLLWYVLLKIGYSPIVVYASLIFSSMLVYLTYLYILRMYSGFSIRNYLLKVTSKVVVLFMLSAVISFAIKHCMHIGMLGTLCNIALSFLVAGTLIFELGLETTVKRQLLCKIKSFVRR